MGGMELFFRVLIYFAMKIFGALSDGVDFIVVFSSFFCGVFCKFIYWKSYEM